MIEVFRLKFGAVVIFIFLFVTNVQAAVVYVPDSYAKIQWAVDNTTTGDVVIVRNGTYQEVVTINKRLNLVGEGKLLVKGRIILNASGIRIKGFQIEGLYPDPCLDVLSDCNVILDNDLTSGLVNEYRIWLNDGIRTTSDNNIIAGNSIHTCSSGIKLTGSNNIIVNNNIFNCLY